MTTTQLADPVLSRFRTALEAHYGPRLDRVVLFGSRARGDARPDSDYDVAIFLHDPGSSWAEARALSGITIDILDATGAVINPVTFSAEQYQERSILMGQVRRDGIDL